MGNYDSLYVPHRGFRQPFTLWDERRASIQATAGKSDFLWSQGISVSTPLEAATSGSLSITYCWGKAPLVVLLESWPTSSIESWESALFSRWCGVHGAFLEFLCWKCCSSRFETVVSVILWICLKWNKPLVLYDVEWGIVLDPIQGSRASSRVDVDYSEQFPIPLVTSVSF